MYAQLGNTLFENLKSITEYSRKGSATYAEHALIDGKPRLQRTGNTLDEITLSMRFHISFCKPTNELDALINSRDEGEVLPLLWGNGIVAGHFVITELEETIEDADPQGNVFSYIVTCVLKEYVVPNRLQQEQHNNRKNGKAVGDKKAVTKKKTNSSTCAQNIGSIVNKIENHQNAINKIVLEQGSTLVSVINKNGVLSHLSAIRLLNDDLLRKCDDPNSCANSYPDLKYRSQQVQLSINNFNRVVADNNAAQVPAENQILAACVRNLKAAARSLINEAITRK